MMSKRLKDVIFVILCCAILIALSIAQDFTSIPTIWIGVVAIFILYKTMLNDKKPKLKAKLDIEHKVQPIEAILKANNEPNTFDEDIDVIVSYGDKLIDLPKDRFLNESELTHSIERIQLAISRLKNHPNVPEAQKKAMAFGEAYLTGVKRNQ